MNSSTIIHNYSTIEENYIKGIEERRWTAKKIRRPVKQFTLDWKLIKIWPGIREAERKTGINDTNIYRCCKKIGKRLSAGGYKWEYADLKSPGAM